jgi:type 1 fimbria pilin
MHSKRSSWIGAVLLGLFFSSYSLQAYAELSSCTVHSVESKSWYTYPAPYFPPVGFRLAQRNMTVRFNYTKTGKSPEPVLTGGYWSNASSYNSANGTVSINGIPGAGLRIYRSNAGNTYFNTQPALTAGNNVALTADRQHSHVETYILEIIVTDPFIFKGGTAKNVQAAAKLSLRSTSPYDDCSDDLLISNDEVFTIGGGTPPEPIPEPIIPTCKAGSEGINLSIDLPPVTPSMLPAVGDLSAGTPVPLILKECGLNARPYITFTDNTDRANRSDTLTLAASSQASGIGLRLMNGANAIRFGSENTSVSSSNIGQFLMGVSKGDGDSITLVLQAHYVRTAPVVGLGTLNASAIITIVYP